MTVRVVVDTHTVLWYLYNDSRLSSTAGALLDTTHVARDQIAMSSVVLAEVVYLIEKGWIDTAAFDRILAALNRVKPNGSPDGSPMRLRQHGTLFTLFHKKFTL